MVQVHRDEAVSSLIQPKDSTKYEVAEDRFRRASTVKKNYAIDQDLIYGVIKHIFLKNSAFFN